MLKITFSSTGQKIMMKRETGRLDFPTPTGLFPERQGSPFQSKTPSWKPELASPLPRPVVSGVSQNTPNESNQEPLIHLYPNENHRNMISAEYTTNLKQAMLLFYFSMQATIVCVFTHKLRETSLV